MEHLPWLLLCLLEREEAEGVEQRSEKKKIQMKKANENILFNFYLQILVLGKTVTQVQLCKY